MYTEYWGFTEKPFENTPDPRFLYLSSKHEEALARLNYAIRERKGAAMLTGEYGSGKTLLARVIIFNLLQQQESYNTAHIINPSVSGPELLEDILYQLNPEIQPATTKIGLLRQINTILNNTANEQRHTVVIIDEAQAIRDDIVFEEIRLLTNFRTDDRFLFTLLLMGQPELREKIYGIVQLEQRIGIRYHLSTLDIEETKKYISHRCDIAGRQESPFTESACDAIYFASGGTPRVINNICDMCLVVGFGEKVSQVGKEIANEVAKDFSYPDLKKNFEKVPL